MDRRTARPARVVAVPTGCLMYMTVRMGLGVTLRLREPPVLRTGCNARLTGLGNSPRRKLIESLPARGQTTPGVSRHQDNVSGSSDVNLSDE
jgi:hypothetical protein